MDTKDKIFKEKKKFKLKYSLPNKFQFQENQEKGEFIDENGNIIAQLWDKDSNPHGFIVAAVFMGEPVYKIIYYNRVMVLEPQLQTPSSSIIKNILST